MFFWKRSLPLLFLAKVDLKQGKVGCLGTGTSVAKQENSDLWLTAQFIFSAADSLFTKWGVDSSRSESTWAHLIPAACILHFFTVLTNTVQNAQPNENSFLSFRKANDPCMICSSVLIMKKKIYLLMIFLSYSKSKTI